MSISPTTPDSYRGELTIAFDRTRTVTALKPVVVRIELMTNPSSPANAKSVVRCSTESVYPNIQKVTLNLSTSNGNAAPCVGGWPTTRICMTAATCAAFRLDTGSSKRLNTKPMRCCGPGDLRSLTMSENGQT